MANEMLGQQDRCGSLDTPSVVALVALPIKRGKDDRESRGKKSI